MQLSTVAADARPPSPSPHFPPPSPPPPLPTLVSLHPTLSIHSHLDLYLTSLHSFLSSFTYKTTPGPEHTPFIQSIKSQPLRVVTHTAERIIAAHLPIKCLEAVVIAIHLTHTITGNRDWRLTRFPLRFHSTCSGHRYWHIVLLLQLTWVGFTETASPSSTPRRGKAGVEGRGSRFAFISLSRHPPLSFSPFSHSSLSSLCTAIRAEYHRIGHHVLHVTVGLPLDGLSDRSKEPLHWHFLSIPLPAAQLDALPPLATAAVDVTEKDGSERGEEEAEDVAGQADSPCVVDSEAARMEWRTVRGILSRYSQYASAVSHQLRLNSRSPSNARPLPPLHPLVHWEPAAQQMQVVYRKEGKSSAAVKKGHHHITADGPLHSARSHRTPPSRETFAV